MKERDANRPSDPIDLLIAEEEAGALARFRSRDFAGRLKRALAEEAAPVTGRPFYRRIPRPAWVAAGILVAAGVALFLVLPRSAPSGSAIKAISAALIRTPGLQAIREPASAAAENPPSLSAPGEGRFAAVLAEIRKSSAPAVPAGTGAPVPSGKERAPHRDLEKTMEILIRDRAVEKVLTQIFQKTKEG
jgi:hypothetical protein